MSYVVITVSKEGKKIKTLEYDGWDIGDILEKEDYIAILLTKAEKG